MTEYYYPHLGGVCEHVHFLAGALRCQGHHADVITSNIGGAAAQPGVIRIGRSQTIPSNGSQGRFTIGLNLRRDLRHLLRAGHYDVVHVHSPLVPTLPLLAVEEAECPVVGTFHTYFDNSRAYAILNRFFQRRIDMMAARIAVSATAAEALRRYFDVDCTIVPNGIDTELFHPGASAPLQMQSSVPSILFLGRFDPRNGLDAMIDAFRFVKGGRREARLVIVGDGPLRKRYYKQAHGDRDIHFVGPVLEGRAGYYANAAAYCCPTTKASFGITLLESMACSTPIVCSDIPAFRAVVTDGREALLVPCGDRGRLADALTRILDDPDVGVRLGIMGRARAMDYSWDRVAARVSDVYASALGASASC